jgi:hypothetical protein
MTTYSDREGSFSSFRPASQNQFDLLKRIIAERDITNIQTTVENARTKAVAGELSMVEASNLIEMIKAQPKREDAGRDNGTLTPGVYRATNGTLYRVYPARADRTRLLAKRVIVTGVRQVAFEYAGAANRFVDASQRLSLEEAKAFGAMTGWCVVCGTELTDPDSIAAGIGPVCATKF